MIALVAVLCPKILKLACITQSHYMILFPFLHDHQMLILPMSIQTVGAVRQLGKLIEFT